MASTLRSKAIKNVTKGNTSAYYSYVEERNGVNPVNQQFEKELNDYMGFVKKKNSGLLKPGEHAPCKVSDVLFDIWNKFEPRVTPRLFYQKLMQIGEYLVENKEYSTASWQCYDRYLNSISDVDFDGIQSVEALKSHFFPNGIDIQENSDMTFRALMGHLICKFHLIVNHDQKLQSTNSVLEVAKIMHNLRMVMQLLFEVEHFCWLIYNATIYMYTIGRFMMQYGQSKIALEYLIFCSLSMECSVALLSSKYLPWRATLYVATCQCYYDCRYYDDGEIFARRALSKINELHELEMASIAGQKGVDIPQFREATIKIGVVLFKRLVYESRRRSKGVYRPKNKLAYKDINNLAWPRTGVEKILNEMFDCSSAQFLAVQEALSDSNRRIAMPGVSGNENENEMFDVHLELLFAAEYLVNGGGGKSPVPNDQLSDFSALVTDNSNILSIAIQGNNGVHIRNYLKIVKFAFNYEAWDVFRRMSLKIIDFIENDPKLFETYKSDLLIIYLLQGADKYHAHLRKLRQIKNEQLKATLVAAKEKSKKDAKNEDVNAKNSNADVEEKSQESKGKKSKSNLKTQSQQNLKVDFAENSKDNETNDQDIASSPGGAELNKEEDMLFNIAYKLILIIDSNIQPEETDFDVAVDITLLLWKKCKEIFQKYQTGSHDNYRWVTKLENFSKWLYILNVTHESMCYFNISSIDPAVFGHCSLRLGLTYESLANINFKRFTKDSSSQFEVQTYDDQYSAAKTNLTKLNFEFSEISSERFGVSNDIRGNLIKAKYVLKKALMAISLARATVSKTDKSCLCDKDYTLDFVELGLKTNVKASTNTRKIEKLKNLKELTFSFQKNIEVDSVTKLIGDLHVELIFLYHKISVRLLQHRDFPIKGEKLLALIDQDFEVLFKECKKNKISQSLLFLSKALSLTHFHLTDQNKLKAEQRNLIQKAYDRLKKAEIEDEILFKKHVQVDADTSVKTKIPPAPIVCLKTFNKIVVQPRKFECTDGTKASWYRVFAGLASNVNLKARISDYGFIGSGEQIPAKTSEKVSISGLSPDEQYIFAVAAYDRNGLLIGDSIGESTDPMLASSTLSILMNWAYLCQVSYQIGDYEMSLSAFKILWNLFVIKPIEPAKETIIIQNKPDYEVSFHQLNYEMIRKTSPILLRKFLECIFIVTDIKIKTKKIFCDILFNGKIQYTNQIDRVRECENLLVAIELAAWLNDAPIILQAIVQCYGLLAPLIYFNLAYEPIIKIISHCLLILEELPVSVFTKKPKNMFENLQHMIACSTFYLTDVLKRFDRKVLSNFFNSIGRKLLGMDESSNNEPVVEEAESEEAEGKQKKMKKQDEKAPTVRQNEIRALENQLAKSNVSTKNAFFNMLTGNEDMAQIYSFIVNNPTKIAYKELIKFRRRNNYFEMLVGLLQKALNEELTQDIAEWSLEIIDWLQKRNGSIIGNAAISKRKPDGFVAKTFASDIVSEMNDTATASIAPTKNKIKTKRKIKKYKLLIPIDLDLNEKIKLEEKQKSAIDLLYDQLPDLYEKWSRRKKFRKILQEESAFKSQFFSINALSNFSQMMNRVNLNSSKNYPFEKVNSISYLDPQNFLFDRANVVIMNFDELPLIKQDSLTVKQKKSEPKATRSHVSPSKVSKISYPISDEKAEIKDTAELIADILNGIESQVSGEETTRSTTDSDSSKRSKFSIGEFVDLSSNIFDRFKIAVVIAHRGKQWTQLQNACKLMFNCINSFILFLPALTATHKKQFRIKDLWRSMSLSIYLAADNLLDMLFLTNPIEKNIHRDIQNKINRWYDSNSVGKCGSGLGFDLPLDDINSIDLRFVKDFVFRSVQCLSSCEKWEKCASIALKFNAITSYKYAEQLSPIVAFCQHKILDQISLLGADKSQKHFEKLKAELGRYPRIEDLFFINFKIEIEQSKLDKLELGTKIDPKVHNIYENNKRCKELISVPLDIDQTLGDLKDAIENSLYHSRALLHARRLLTLFLLTKTPQTDFFAVNQDQNSAGFEFENDETTTSVRVGFQSNKTNKSNFNQSQFINSFFHSNPINFSGKDFKNENDVFVKDIKIDLNTIIESYTKCIQLLVANKENDQAIQALHELGNVYHFSNDLEMAYKNWNEALDKLTGINNCLINWRKNFVDPSGSDLSTENILKKCGIWGCLLGGVLTSKMAQYYLSNDLELKTECCLLSATFFKSIFRGSIPYSRHDFDYSKNDLEFINSDYLLPGLMFNSEIFRFDVRYVISSLNYVCIELLNAGHYLYIMPSVVLYEYFAKMLCRDLSHTILARLIKIEALTQLNMFTEAISILCSIQKGENLPHYIDDKGKNFSPELRYIEYNWNSSKPVFDLNNLKSLETVLSLKLPYNIIKLYGAHLSSKFYLIQCKLLVQIASCIPCSPNFKEFDSSQLFNFHDSFVLNIANFQGIKLPSSFSNSRKPVEIIDDFDTDLEDNPEVIKIFSKATGPLSLEFIKGCVLGSAKTIINKCLKAFGEDFPKTEKYTISNYWQREFKYELHILLANIADQSHLTYLALQNVFDGMKELAAEEIPEAVKEKKALVSALKKNKTNIPKQLKTIKRGVYQVFDSISRSHINSRLWLKARMLFLQYMFNQLNDIGKAKGHDDSIVKDFTDLKYYCEKSINESNEFFDFETKSFFMLIEICLELLRGASLKICLSKLNNCILNLVSTNNQLSHHGFLTYLKANILKSDIEFSINLLECQDAGSSDKNKLSSSIDVSMNSLLGLQDTILNNLSKNSGEKIELFTDKSKSYFDSIYKEIKNLYNPFLHYLVHTKLRLGSCLMLKSSYHDNQMISEGPASNKLWHHSLNVLGSAIEINKVISERSLNLEIELNYKYSHCIRELFITRQVGTLNDIVESYGHTINLLNNSTHDLHLIKQCYLELAVGFISTFDSSVILDTPSRKPARETSLSMLTSSSNTPSSSAKPGSKSRKTAVQSSRAIEAALTALALAIRTSNAIKEKMLLSGNESIKNMASIQTSDCPIFVPNDLIAYHVFAERKRIYRDEIEEEVLSLAPEFDLKEEYKSYDDKVQLLADESDKCITWIHVLNYQTKLQSTGSMRNLNTLKNGKNRYKYSEFYTIGLTPVFKSCHLMASRLFELNSYLRDNLDIYSAKCQAQEPITDFFRIFARKSTAQTNARASANLNTLLQYVKVYNGNLSNNMSVVNYAAINDVESIRESLMSSQSNKANTAANDWSYLQTWPANFNFSSQSTLKINESSSYDSFADYMLTMSWQKNLAVIDEDVYGNGDDLLCIIAVRDQLTSNKIKFRYISAGEVLEIHEKLVPLSAIADTALNNESEMNIESNSQFMTSLKSCLTEIALLFGKKFNDKKLPFELTTSNIHDLESMFNINFGGFTCNESLKNYILNLFI